MIKEKILPDTLYHLACQPHQLLEELQRISKLKYDREKAREGFTRRMRTAQYTVSAQTILPMLTRQEAERF